MRTLPGVLLLWCIAAAAAARPNAEKKIERREILQSPNGITGVASFAGITNRNGRVSSLTGIRLLPATDDSVTVTSNGSPYLYPLTVTREADGKYASGSIQFYPGSVLVSSSASSGYAPDLKLWPKINMPLPSDMFFQPPTDFFETTKNIDPWFPKEIFKAMQPPQINIPPSFIYPHFNPFLNLWR